MAGDAGAIAGHGLDLDDVGAVVSQDLRAERARQHLREVDHAEAGEGAGGITRGLHASVQGGRHCGRRGFHYAAALPRSASEMIRIWISEVPSKILVRRDSPC